MKFGGPSKVGVGTVLTLCVKFNKFIICDSKNIIVEGKNNTYISVQYLPWYNTLTNKMRLPL